TFANHSAAKRVSDSRLHSKTFSRSATLSPALFAVQHQQVPLVSNSGTWLRAKRSFHVFVAVGLARTTCFLTPYPNGWRRSPPIGSPIIPSLENTHLTTWSPQKVHHYAESMHHKVDHFSSCTCAART